MPGASGPANDRVDVLQALGAALADRPWAHDFYQVLRRVEAAHPHLPRLGEAARPAAEPLRLAQQVELSFAPSNISGAQWRRDGKLRISVRFLGLFGPQAPLPLHLTEFVRERERSHNDPTLARFADVFHHRMLLLFFRAWRQAQPAANRDRPSQDRFMTYAGALIGAASPSMRDRDSVSDEAKRYFSGHLGRSVRHADALISVLSAQFDCSVSVEQYAARWIALPAAERTQLGRAGDASTLGVGAVVGAKVFDAQHQVALKLGPLHLAQYLQLLPGQPQLRQLRDWVRNFLSDEYDVRAQLLLRTDQVPRLQLGSGNQLGWTSWLGDPNARDSARPNQPAGDLTVQVSAV